MKRILLALTASLLLLACAKSCYPDPVGPGPDGGTGGAFATGGSVSTGGAAYTGGQGASGGTTGVDGRALCLTAMVADPIRQVEARDNGMTVEQLASTACSYVTVQQCFAKGICK